MRFDPQANFVADPETETVQHVAPIAAEPVLGARSPMKTAMVIVVIGFVVGASMWLWSEGVPGAQEAAADTGSVIDDSIVQYAEAVINGKTDFGPATASSSPPIEQRLTGAARRRAAGGKAQDEFRSGRHAMGMGDHDQAVAHFKEAIRIDPRFADAHYRLGLAYVRLGNFTDARREQAFLKQLGDDRANLLGHLVDN